MKMRIAVADLKMKTDQRKDLTRMMIAKKVGLDLVQIQDQAPRRAGVTLKTQMKITLAMRIVIRTATVMMAGKRTRKKIVMNPCTNINRHLMKML